MAYPQIYEVTYSYSGFQQAQGDNSFPGTQLDSDLAGLEQSIANLEAFLQAAFRSDGKLTNKTVDLDQLSTGVNAALGSAPAITEILDAATAAATSAGAAATSATNAAGGATAAATSASGALTSASSASASAVSSATSATNSANSAAAAAATLAAGITGVSASADGEVVLFSGTTGKAAKRSNTLTGLLKLTAGVAGAAAAGTDYLAPAAIGVSVQAFDAQLFSNIPQTVVSGGNYTLVAADAQKHIFHGTAEASTRTVTIPANASVPYPIGTAITFIVQNGSGAFTIAINSDTMRLAGFGTTGSRTLVANGVATAIKVASTEWIISGTGLS